MSNVKPKLITGKSVCFFFNTKNCFKEASGICSLFANENFKNQYPNLEEKATPERCPKILELMQVPKSKLFPVYLYKYRCGQHRICVAGQKGLEIKVILGTIKNQDCDYCVNPKSFTLKNF